MDWGTNTACGKFAMKWVVIFACNAFAYIAQSLAYFAIATVLSYMLTARYIKDNKINPARVIAYILVR